MKRRDALVNMAGVALGAGATVAGVAGVVASRPGPQDQASGTGDRAQSAGGARMPTVFVAHGYPMWTYDRARIDELAGLAQSLPRPKSVLMVSAHWEARPVTLGATTTVPLVYDFSGFPEELYRVQYPAPGAPALADRVEGLLAGAGIASAREPQRGLDHGAYLPMQFMYPDADVPVLQMSLPTLDASTLLAVGRALSPLRDEGVLIVGSGFLTHNLRRFDPRPDAPTPAWASEFDAWAAETLRKRDADALVQYRQRAPGVQIALPTHEHFVPVIVALGASLDHAEAVSFPITGWEAGSLTRRAVQMG
jgi:4,5-DOPA dioxygenase extradiol